jgi:hypothetical protein
MRAKIFIDRHFPLLIPLQRILKDAKKASTFLPQEEQIKCLLST